MNQLDIFMPPVEALLAQHAARFRDDFPGWLADNFHIYARFVQETNKVRLRGRKHYSARTIIEFLRHESGLTEATGPWKINGNYIPDMARLYVLQHPDAEGFFEMRVQYESKRVA